MASPQTTHSIVILLLLSVTTQDCSETSALCTEEPGTGKSAHVLSREKRDTASNITFTTFEYTLQISIEVFDFEQLRIWLRDRLPSQINNSTSIFDIDTTTVCSPSNATGYQCRCEDQFVWSYSSCVQYGACDVITNYTCGCIRGLPPGGQYCQPPTGELSRWSVEVELNTSDLLVIDLLRAYLEYVTISSVFFNSTSAQVSQANLTTVCYPTRTDFQCRCEDRFGWSCDQCSLYGFCDEMEPGIRTRVEPALYGTCECVNVIPPNGQFCQPITNLTTCPAPFTTAVTPPIQTPANTTMTNLTPTLASTTTTLPTTTAATTTTLTTTAATTTTAKTTIPKATTTTTSLATTTTTTTTVVVRKLSFQMDLDFDPAYNDINHEKFQEIDQAIKNIYRSAIRGFISAQLDSLRSGSVIADYTVSASAINPEELVNARSSIVAQLGERFKIITDSETNLVYTPNPAYAGDDLTLSCGPPPVDLNFESFNSEWKVKGRSISSTGKYSTSTENLQAKLTVRQLLVDDSGDYECLLSFTSVFRQRVSLGVLPAPNIRLTPIRVTVQCSEGQTSTPLKCCVDSSYSVQLKDGNNILDTVSIGPDCIQHDYTHTSCDVTKTFTCELENSERFTKVATIFLSSEDFACVNDADFGSGQVGDTAVGACEEDEVGEQTATCLENGAWKLLENNCVLKVFADLFSQSQFLNAATIAQFLDTLSTATQNLTGRLVQSPASIATVVDILNNVANVSQGISVDESLMEDVLLTVDILTSDEAVTSWNFLNSNTTDGNSESSQLLNSIETISDSLSNESFEINTTRIILIKTTFTDSFISDLNSSVVINIPASNTSFNTITTITFASLNNVLPARNSSSVNDSVNIINGNVVLVKVNNSITNVSFTFDLLNDTLANPQCVFWNFSLFNGLGGWDDEGCELQSDVNGTVTCNCNHLTSFSILMSPFIPEELRIILDFITYIGVGISMGCLVVCLIIEACVWKSMTRNSTSYMRHVSIVNIAVSLLIADIWFIIGASISDAESKNPPACSAATFFIHVFYLSLFFWMLVSALLLVYRIIWVFSHMPKSTMLAISFSLGYGAPLVIAIITIAVTAPKEEYTGENGVCWLNWDESMALLAFVIPALSIVAINFIILIVVLYKMLRRGVGDTAQSDEKSALVVIAKCLAILTPFFGLTWALGVGTLTDPGNGGIHIAFAFFNSLQGFFILVFGTLLDQKIKTTIAEKLSSNSTRSTGVASSSSTGILGIWRRRKNVHVSTAAASSSSGAHETFPLNT